MSQLRLLFEDDNSTVRRNEITVPVDQSSDVQSSETPPITLSTLPRNIKDSHLKERPKAVASRKRKHALYQSLIHIPAIFMTLGALSLTYRGTFWQAPTSSTNTILNLLQFVAKIHETLIIFSLTEIVFHRLRYEIINRCGVPFGLLSVALQYSSLPILVRKDLRHILVRPRQFYKFLGTASMIVFSLALSIACGPSAAIAILPRLDWWLVPLSHNISSPAYPPAIYFNTTAFPSTVIYPLPCSDKILGEVICYWANQCLANTTNNPWSPSSGLEAILKSGPVTSLMVSGTTPALSQIIMSSPDISTDEDNFFFRSLYGSMYEDANQDTAFVASVIPDLVAVTLASFWQSVGNEENYTRPMAKTSSLQSQAAGLQKPLVQVDCTGSNNSLTDSTSDIVTFPSTFHYPRTTSNSSWTKPLAELLHNKTSNEAGSIDLLLHNWVNLTSSENNAPSASVIFAANQRSLPGGSASFASSLNQTCNTFACTIDAVWIPSDAWIDPTVDDMIHESTTNPLEEQHYFRDVKSSIQLAQSWLNALDARNSYSPDAGGNYTSLQSIGLFCMDGYTSPASVIERCFESVLASYIADGLARMQTTTGRFMVWEGIEQFMYLSTWYSSDLNGIERSVQSWFNDSQDEMPQFTINTFRYGYGYGFQDSKTIYIATAILLLHLLVALIHIAFLIGGGWSSDAWSTPGEVIALAVNSLPTVMLQNTCGGIESSEVWTKIISVKETEGNILGIVFDEGSNHRMRNDNDLEIRMNSLGISKTRRRVRPDQKYGLINPVIKTQISAKD